MKRAPLSRLAWPLLVLLAVSLPLVVWGMHQGFERANNNIAQWLPEGYPETKDYARFRELFGSEEFSLVTWPGCTLTDKGLKRLAERIEEGNSQQPGDHAAADSLTRWFERVRTGPELIRVLTDEPLRLTPEQAAERLEGTLVGPKPAGGDTSPSDRLSGALLTLSPAGHANRTAAVHALRRLAAEAADVPEDQIRLGGDAVTNAAIDIESEQAVRNWVVLSWAIALAVAWICLRSVKLVAMVFIVSGYSSVLSSALIYFTGATMNLVLVIVPVLVYVLTLSACVHLSNYYRDAVRQQGTVGAAAGALRVGWLPAVTAAGTTALGLVSLLASHLRPVQQFGVFSALGTMASVGVALVLLPAMFDRWPTAQPKPTGRGRGGDRSLARAMAHWIVRFRLPVLVVSLGLLVVLAVGVGFIRTSVSPGRFFDRQSRWVQDAEWIQQHLGPIVPLEVMLEFPRRPGSSEEPAAAEKHDSPGRGPESAYALTFLQRLELTDRVTQLMKRHEQIGGTLSAATFGPNLKEIGTGWLARSVANRQLRENRHLFERMGFVRHTLEVEYWRISARVPGFSNVDHDVLLKEIEREVHDYFRKAGLTDRQVRATFTGVVPLVFVAQRELLAGLFESFLLAFALIGLVMIALLRSPVAGALAMLPNVFPAVTVFGLMGWTGTLVDVGSMMTASVAMGIAVDDTIHFLTWFRRSRAAGRSNRGAVVEAYERCAAAMTQTTLIAGLGLIVFARSEFLPVAQFGLLMFILLVAALVGDLLLLPAILATRLGKGFAAVTPPRRRGMMAATADSTTPQSDARE